MRRFINPSKYNASRRFIEEKLREEDKKKKKAKMEKLVDKAKEPPKRYVIVPKREGKKGQKEEKEKKLPATQETKKGKPKSKARDLTSIINKVRKKTIVKENKMIKKAVKFGIVGLGQAGGRMAAAFEVKGYPTIAINTSKQDLEKLECKNKLAIGEDGAGKDLKIGSNAVNDNRNEIMNMYRQIFKDVQHILVCAGSSGGTGGGGLIDVVESANDMKLPVGVLTTLPLDTEDTRSKKNTLKVINSLVKLNQEKKIKPLIIIDNNKIEKKHPGLSTLAFWNVANEEVADAFDTFNRLCATSTEYTSLDPADYKKIINSGGCMILGNVKITDVDTNNVNIFSDAILENINNGLFAEGFNLVEATKTGCIIAANPDHLNKIPRQAEENAVQTIMDIIGSGSVYKGVYGLKSLINPEVFFMMSGLGLPIERVRSLIKSVQTETTHFKEKETHRTVSDIMKDLDADDSIDLDGDE